MSQEVAKMQAESQRKQQLDDSKKEKERMVKEDMKKLRKIVEVYYKAVANSQVEKDTVETFKRLMMENGKEESSTLANSSRISKNACIKWLLEGGNSKYVEDKYFFKYLLQDENNGVSELEFKILKYITESRRPFCSSCKCFIPDIFYCCSFCTENEYAICMWCYNRNDYIYHKPHYDEGAVFLDCFMKQRRQPKTPADPPTPPQRQQPKTPADPPPPRRQPKTPADPPPQRRQPPQPPADPPTPPQRRQSQTPAGPPPPQRRQPPTPANPAHRRRRGTDHPRQSSRNCTKHGRSKGDDECCTVI